MRNRVSDFGLTGPVISRVLAEMVTSRISDFGFTGPVISRVLAEIGDKPHL